MKSEMPKPLQTKKPLKFIKILLYAFGIVALIFFTLKTSDYIYCHTIAICDDFYASPEIRATQLKQQYEAAIQDIEAKRYENAQQRLEFIIYRDPKYPGVAEKLVEVEKLLHVTPTP
jgi:hypothetical protein